MPAAGLIEKDLEICRILTEEIAHLQRERETETETETETERVQKNISLGFHSIERKEKEDIGLGLH